MVSNELKTALYGNYHSTMYREANQRELLRQKIANNVKIIGSDEEKLSDSIMNLINSATTYDDLYMSTKFKFQNRVKEDLGPLGDS